MLAKRVNRFLKKEYPEAKCSLKFSCPLDLLVATILSAQCTDERVNKITRELFGKYRKAEDYAEADPIGFMTEIYSSGFYKNKCKNIIASAKIIVEEFGGEVPDTMEELLTLPGVGRKTGNVVLGYSFRIASGIVVDTHVKRLSKRIGLTDNIDPLKIEKDLNEVIPPKDWIAFGNRMIKHGRQVCTARKPGCNNCGMEKFCEKNF